VAISHSCCAATFAGRLYPERYSRPVSLQGGNGGPVYSAADQPLWTESP